MTNQEQSRLHAIVHGRVQGVGFRDFTVSRAESLGLTGWVRNLQDGNVEVIVEGPHEALQTLLDGIRRGPPHAIVRQVDVAWNSGTGEFQDFRARW